jgi:hypothetical protein
MPHVNDASPALGALPPFRVKEPIPLGPNASVINEQTKDNIDTSGSAFCLISRKVYLNLYSHNNNANITN